MGKLQIEVCGETGICSIVKADGTKVDLMPDEVDGLRQAAGKPELIKKVLADVDAGFAAQLQPEELAQVSAELH